MTTRTIPDYDHIPCWIAVLAMLLCLGSMTVAFSIGANGSERNRIERLRAHGERCQLVARAQCPDVWAKMIERGG